MSRLRIVLLAAAVVTAAPAAIAAQAGTGLRVHLNAAAAVGEYGETEGERAGHAALGGGLGFALAFRIAEDISWLTTVAGAAHPAGPGLIEAPHLEPGCAYAVYSALTGLRMGLVTPNVSISGALQGGMLGAFCPAGVWVEDQEPRHVYRGWYAPPGLAVAAEAGIGLPRGIEFGARWVLAPALDFEERIEYFDPGSTVRTETTRPVTFVDLYLAYWIR